MVRLSDARIRATSKTSDIVLLWLLWAQFALGLAIVCLHNLLDPITLTPESPWYPLWALFHQRSLVELVPGTPLDVPLYWQHARAASALLDGLGRVMGGRADLGPLQRAGGRVTWFVPPLHSPLKGRTNLRNHRKLLVVDGRVGFTGGVAYGVPPGASVAADSRSPPCSNCVYDRPWPNGNSGVMSSNR